ncbi:MAG: translesion DNA synthesis-associated protein ImuA [Burkholderiales bacterium]|nr:translesion DNA synthesis-associated protein ImuA [Burkholderiales bacterium]
MISALDTVLRHPAVWRGGGWARAVTPGIPTGYAGLDAVLPGGGWPVGALTEIHVERAGVGELQIFMPAAVRLTRSGSWLVLIEPLYLPYAPAFAARGVILSRLMLVRAVVTGERLWACAEALRSRSCGAVLAWFDHVHERALRRLQLAAEDGKAAMLLFRPARAASTSPAALRLHVGKSRGRTLIHVLKRRGGALPAPIALDLYEREGTGPFLNFRGAFPFPPHPPSHEESCSRETSGAARTSVPR